MDRLDLRLVEYFVAVAEELHFGRAAARLHIAQPSLSQQIRRLEAQLGSPLLERNSRNVRLTAAGEVLLREGRRTLAQARRTIRATRAAAVPRVVVGFFGSAGDALLPEALRRFGATHGFVDLTVRELPFGSMDPVIAGEVDLAFCRLRPEQTDLEVEVLAQEPRVVALAAAHRLASRAAVSFADLTEESFITNPAVADDDGPPPRWLAEQRRHGLPGRVAAESRGLSEILTLVAAGRGVCLVPASVAENHPRDDVRYRPVTDADPAVISLAWLPGGLSPSAAGFASVVRDLGSSATRALRP